MKVLLLLLVSEAGIIPSLTSLTPYPLNYLKGPDIWYNRPLFKNSYRSHSQTISINPLMNSKEVSFETFQ